jgi:photoactive yellow protein
MSDTQTTDGALYAADQLSSGELDALPYGMIQLDSRGRILRYSQAETRLSGLTADECVGRHFFDEIAPCTHVQEFYGRFRDGVQAGQLDAVFNFRFAFVPPREVRVHMFYSKVTRSVWVKVVDLGDTHGVSPGVK